VNDDTKQAWGSLVGNYRASEKRWTQARAALRRALTQLKALLQGMVDEIDEEEAELCFRLFGAECYARLHHDLKTGSVEVGVFVAELDGRRHRKAVSNVAFQERGDNFAETAFWLDRLHREAPELVSAFYRSSPEDE